MDNTAQSCWNESFGVPANLFRSTGRIEWIGAANEESADAAVDHGRILFLSGQWQRPDSHFRFEAVVFVQAGGALEGVIYWKNIRTAGFPATFGASESVRGNLNGQHIELRGYRAEPGLATDHYQIALIGGDTSGVFGGKSRAYGDWSGRMNGNYRFSSFERG